MSENAMTWFEPDMPDEIKALPRQQRRHWVRQQVKAKARKPQQQKRQSVLQDPLAFLQAQSIAFEMLRTGPSSKPPTERAVRKMARYLLASPLHSLTYRHQRGSWRTWPRNIGVKELNEFREQEKHAS
jgi:hypothetical protein